MRLEIGSAPATPPPRGFSEAKSKEVAVVEASPLLAVLECLENDADAAPPESGL